jgi:hypothetical protein
MQQVAVSVDVTLRSDREDGPVLLQRNSIAFSG